MTDSSDGFLSPNASTAVLTVSQMRAAEAVLFASGTAPLALMERAGRAAARAIAAWTGPCPTLVACGPGNNGGDGYVVAAELAGAGWPVRVAATDAPASDPARAARAAWAGPVEPLAAAAPAPLLVDALFGIGARPLGADTAATLAQLAARRVVALDLPSGVVTDTGAHGPSPPCADLTVAFGALKPAHLLHPAAALCGRLVVVDLGLDLAAARLWRNGAPAPPPPARHKYERGHVLVLAGPAGRGGAARLAARAALRFGAGLVTIAAPVEALAEHTTPPDALMRRALDRPADLAALVEANRARVVALGPGLGTDARARALAEAALALPVALVLDADIFTLFAAAPAALRRAPPTVLTPHEGEYARLMGVAAADAGKVERARAMAAATGAVVALKGADTVIAAPDGKAAINLVDAPGLATAGSGDVLTGIVAARLAMGEDAYAAACAAVWVHARAGFAAGPGLIADDLVAAA